MVQNILKHIVAGWILCSIICTVASVSFITENDGWRKDYLVQNILLLFCSIFLGPITLGALVGLKV